MSLTRQKAISILKNNPVKFGRMVGFNKLTNLHNEWIIDMVFGDDDETLQAHRGSYKTTCVSIALTIIMITAVNDKTAFLRKTDTDIKEVISQCKKILEHSATRYFVQVIWGVDLKLTKATANEISTNLTNDPRGTAQLVGMGLGGSLTGKHFDRIFTDDIVNIQDRISRAERERTKLVYQELQNIINRGGRIFNTGTPWHKEDCFELMPNPIKYDCYSTGLISDEELDELRDNMLGSLFAANYELKHIASEDIIFAMPIMNADKELVKSGQLSHIDAAYTDGADYTAFTVVRKFKGKYYVYGRLWHKAVDKIEDEIIADYKTLLCNRLYCEKNADKGLLAKELRRKYNISVGTYHESENKFQKIVTYLKWAWKDVVFVEGTDREYIEQICNYNEFAEHDDAPDSLASAIRKLWNVMDNVPIRW